MLNKDINLRFEDWLLNPSEALDFEVKRWLNMADVEAQGTVAKALIALENHGGGFLLFGFLEDGDGKLVPDPDRPASLDPFLTDALNSIVRKRAQPSFHVEVSLQRDPSSGLVYPLARVSGRTKVPVRSESATAGGSLKQNIHYIRAPGPESREPRSGAEWDALIRRVVLNQRDEITSLLRGVLGPSGLAQGSGRNELTEFAAAAVRKWQLLNESLPADHRGRIELGYFSFAARVLGSAKEVHAQDILRAVMSGSRYSGWPAFVYLPQEDTSPKSVDGCLEAWCAKAPFPDVDHADFWRIRKDGYFFQLRGYQEDARDPNRTFATPGKHFEATLPIWRIGEFLLRVSELAELMFEEQKTIEVQCKWTGLTGRQLFVHQGRRWLGSGTASDNEVCTKAEFNGDIASILPEAVKVLTTPLYEVFGFTKVSDTVYQEELSTMARRQF